MKKSTGIILSLLEKLSVGDSFYVDLPPNVITSYSYKAGVKCSTEKILIIENIKKEEVVTRKMTKVTLV